MIKKIDDHDQAELLVIGGVFTLLLVCIIIEAWKPEANLENLLNGLIIVLTSIGSALFGKKAAVANQQQTAIAQQAEKEQTP